MQLKFIPYVSKEERRALKPKVGDTVVFEGQKYIVKEMGMKYANVEKAERPGITYTVKLSDVYKYVPMSTEQQESGPKTEDIAFDSLK